MMIDTFGAFKLVAEQSNPLVIKVTNDPYNKNLEESYSKE
tara:strand:- start:2741 stop:2860 length:120 start_codon:yes stop_codon:yes gene_type:complete